MKRFESVAKLWKNIGLIGQIGVSVALLAVVVGGIAFAFAGLTKEDAAPRTVSQIAESNYSAYEGHVEGEIPSGAIKTETVAQGIVVSPPESEFVADSALISVQYDKNHCVTFSTNPDIPVGYCLTDDQFFDPINHPLP